MAAFAPPFGRGTRGQHFTGFQYQPPGRQPFGLKVESPRLPPAGRPPSRRGALGRQAHSLSRGSVEARIRPRIERQAGPTPPAGCPSLRRTAHSITRGRAEAWNRPRNQWRAKPQPPCTVCRLRRGPGPSLVNLWPLSFDQESGDPGVGRLPDNFSNHCITHDTN